ncbi:MAG: hypothetical protein LQ340_004858 [Diploschistes diacapsis]|nr:MAG: hypothetical protein LQ340_004858 [Diploschistes diacapsis]
MAPRLLHPSRPSKGNDQKQAEKQTKLSKRASVSAAPATLSKIPLQSPSWSRSSNNKTKKPNVHPTGLTSEPRSQITTCKERGELPGGKRTSQLVSDVAFSLDAETGGHSPVTTMQAPSEHRLRRRLSSQDQRPKYTSLEPSEHSSTVQSQRITAPETSTDASPDAYPGSVLGISLPTLSPPVKEGQSQSLPQMPPELAHLHSQAGTSRPLYHLFPTSTPDLKPPTPNFARSNSASTRHSESRSPWSTASTTTSDSSHSPANSQISKFATRTRLGSPKTSRPPVPHRKLAGQGRDEEGALESKGLPAVRESMISSSSSSTMRNAERTTEASQVAKKNILWSPTPPMRISSKTNQHTKNSASNLARQTPESSILLLPEPPQIEMVQHSKVRSKSSASNIGQSKVPPPRPSREGMPTLESSKPSPVIQSNLPCLATAGYKRRDSTSREQLGSPSKAHDTCALDAITTSRPPPVTSDASRNRLRIPTATKEAKATGPHLYSRKSSRSRERTGSRSNLEQQIKREPSPLFTSPSKSLSRFGLFSTKSKSPLESSTSQATDKSARKGPAAGTGHEGYGRYARRGRSGSTSTAASRGRSTSTDRTSSSATRPASSRKSSFTSNDGKAELDDFLKARLEPVFIGGGGRIRDDRNSSLGLYQMENNQSSSVSVESIAAPVRAPPSQASYPPSSNASSDNLSADYPSRPFYPTTLDSTPDLRPGLAHRRSLHRLQLFGEAPPVRIPAPINTRVLADSPALDTYDSTLSSLPQTDTSLPLTDDVSEGHEGNWLNPKKKVQEDTKTRKWNIFHRPQRSSERAPEALGSNDSWADLPKSVAAFGDPRPIAHYAIVDGFDSEGSENLEDALRNIEENLKFDSEEKFTLPDFAPQPREPSMLLPSPPKFPSAFEPFPTPISLVQADLQLSSELSPSPEPRNPPGRIPRLQQIGRIPQVVSKRDRNFRPSPQSFSRPFAPRGIPDLVPKAESSREPAIPASTPISADDHPILGLKVDAIPPALFSTELHHHAGVVPVNGMLHNLDGEHEFLRFSRRQDSDVSGTNSSGILDLTPVTATLPTPDAVLSDDEVWDEFDDLLDIIASPSSTAPDTPGLPKYPDSCFGPNHFPTQPKIGTGSNAPNDFTLPEAAQAAAHQTYKPVLPPRPSFLDPPSDRDQLSSPMSLSDLYAGYGSRPNAAGSVVRNSNASTTSGSRYSEQTIISEPASPNIDDARTKRVTQVLAEKTYNASSDSLRFSSLMASRWLSFDRVLFSPVQAELRSSRQDRILVVDGLENDDWSTYCALTYPEANVYNLCTSSALWLGRPTEVSNADKWMAPTNHRRISYANLSAPFPFPKGFFTAVVFRFPAANTEHAYRNAVSECKRVLRPGGYVELTILDMDMVSMGNHVSRAIRNLKVRMQAALPDISLSPASDNVMKLLGRKGFENISRCVVGVPVTGAVSDSRAGSFNDPRSTAAPDREAETGAQLSLGALLAGQAQNADLHYPVTKMVARVARWWWSKCYEKSVLGESRESMWSDKQLLRECENRETGLRLVICYAQKPIGARRRTVSV